MNTDQLDYVLPEDLIAMHPVKPRDTARMMVVHHARDDPIEHATVADLPRFLEPGDVLVVNDTAVAPARLLVAIEDSDKPGGVSEGLFLGEAPQGEWSMMLRGSRRLRSGMRLRLVDPATGEGSAHAIELLERAGACWRVRLHSMLPGNAVLAGVGLTPLPPYILRRRVGMSASYDDASDRAWYQTIYADAAKCQSVAAPTAGLHFTPKLLERLAERGVGMLSITLHVGPGTFRPVAAERLEDHRMDEEHFSVARAVLREILQAREHGRRVIAVGTTTVRALESINPHSLAGDDDDEAWISGSTGLMICPPFEFRWIDGLLTNFHLPRSTLLALVAAFAGDLDRVKCWYAEAVQRRYRFYSFGDCMLILR